MVGNRKTKWKKFYRQNKLDKIFPFCFPVTQLITLYLCKSEMRSLMLYKQRFLFKKGF